MNREKAERRLKESREMYSFHFEKNKTQARGLNLLYFGNECKKYRKILDDMDADSE